MDKCPSCPLRNRPEPCYARTTGHARFCQLIAEGREDYARLILEKSVGSVGSAANPIVEGQGGVQHPVAPPQPEHPSVAEMHRRLSLVRECPHWVRGSLVEGCGCGTSFCKLGKGKNGKVTSMDCFACLGI